jgi:arylsulfatase A-like enzyme/Flp pilus assembly protein TadD
MNQEKAPRNSGNVPSTLRRCLILQMVLWFAWPVLAGQPNIVLVTLDTTRADRMGFLGSSRGLTPNLDSLSREAIICENAYTQAPLTTVSHATILTGTYPQFHRVTEFGTLLPSRIPDLPALLRQHKYLTAAFIGSIVLDPRNGLAPGFDRGFDVYDANYKLRSAGEDRYKTVERRANEVIQRALAWIAQNSNAPFFIWIHLYDPHKPYDPPAPYAKRFASDPYDGEIAYTDAALGKLFAYLRSHALFETSTIAVMADHGEALGQHGEEAHGIFLYDETVHVPLLIKLPEGRFAGRRISSRVRLVDVAPTILEAAAIPIPDEMQGESLLRTLAANAPERAVYSETSYPEQGFGWSEIRSLREGKYLFIQAPRRELYDVSADPLATHNLAESRTSIADTLEAQLMEMQERYSSAPASSNQGTNMTPDQQKALTALGYVGGKNRAGSVVFTGADPKDKIAIANQLQDAMLLIETDHSAEAIPLLKRVTFDDPNTYVAQYQLGLAEENQRDYSQAILPLTKATELMPGSSLAEYELGVVLFESGDWKSAAGHLEKASTLSPEWPDAHFSLAAVYARIDRVPEAIQELQTALRLRPEHYRANLLMGRILFLEGHPKDALPNLEEAVKVQPMSREPHLFLADAYSQLGMEDQADSERQKAEHLPAPKQ